MARARLIHIPDKQGVYYAVLVKPQRIYGGVLGRDLIKRYSKKTATPVTPVKLIQTTF